MSNEKNKKVWNPDVHSKLSGQPSPVTLRHHQLAPHDRMSAHFLNDKKLAGLSVVPTGGGKTLLATHWLLNNHLANVVALARPPTQPAPPPLEGMARFGGAFARDPHTGVVYFIHRGRIGGGQKASAPSCSGVAFAAGSASARVHEPGREDACRVVVVGKIGAPEFTRDVAGFVHEVARIKAAQ